MPLIMLKTSVPIPVDKTDSILAAMSKLVAEATGKPESYIMATLEHVEGIMAEETSPLAFADVRGIGGLTSDVNNAVSSKLCALLKRELGIQPDRVYMNFTDVSASSWGWKGGTFG